MTRYPDHRLEFLDQMVLKLSLATGRRQLIQCVWIYDRPLDPEGLERFTQNFSQSLGNRLVELSPLPFGRPRWVMAPSAPPPLHIGEATIARVELLAWANQQADQPLDPLQGPGWLLSSQAFSDGSAAVSMLSSHVIGDGIGGMLAIHEAISGQRRNPGYASTNERSLFHSLRSDLRQSARDLPATSRALAKAAQLMVRRSKLPKASASPLYPSPAAAAADPVVELPSAAIFIPLDQWKHQARRLRGNSFSLLAGLTARLAQRMGRCRASDGAVSLLLPINLRESLDDDRAFAVQFSKASIDPTTVTSDLAGVRTAIRLAHAKARQEPDPLQDLLPLLPWLPPAAVRGAADLMFEYGEDLPVTCSNLGDLFPDLARIDGTPAKYVLTRGLDNNVKLSDLQRTQGHLVVVSSRINGTISIGVEAFQLNTTNSRANLRRLAQETLAEFRLEGVIESGDSADLNTGNN
jgi:hypothetical protein